MTQGVDGLLGATLRIDARVTARVTGILVDASLEPLLLRLEVDPRKEVAYVAYGAVERPPPSFTPTCGRHVLLGRSEASFYERAGLQWVAAETDVSSRLVGGIVGA